MECQHQKGKRIHNKSIYCEGSDNDGSSDEVKDKIPSKVCDSISENDNNSVDVIGTGSVGV